MGRTAMSFDELVQRHRRELLAYLVRMLGNMHDAEDAWQDALLRAYRAYPRLRPHSNLRAWLYRIATRSALNTARSRARRAGRWSAVEIDALPGAGGDPHERERVRRLVDAVHGLPHRQRAALMQRRFQGLDYDAIGAALGCTPAAARANVYQALKKLRAVLEDQKQ